jgi:hypothetical protein
VVQRIFAEYMEGVGDCAIAKGLNQDGVPCPSECQRDQNRHRLADGWQGSTVRSILENPRYTGYAIFGRWTKHETLLNPDDVGTGHVVRFKRAAPERVVRSRRPAHPEIVSVETFTRAQLMRRSRAAGGLPGIAKLERNRSATKHTYLLKGLVRCEICTRKMQGAAIRTRLGGPPTTARTAVSTKPAGGLALLRCHGPAPGCSAFPWPTPFRFARGDGNPHTSGVTKRAAARAIPAR